MIFERRRLIKKILSYIYVYSLKAGKAPTISEIAAYIGIISRDQLKGIIKEMIKKGYIDNKLTLTLKGRKLITVGLIGGVFDILHKGHILTLKKAKEKVDVLVVVIARNSTVKKFKGRSVIMDEKDRRDIVNSIKYVDIALLGSKEDFMEPVNLVKPDIIFLGYDQEIPPPISDKIPPNKIVKLNNYISNVKTSNIINKIKKLKF